MNGTRESRNALSNTRIDFHWANVVRPIAIPSQSGKAKEHESELLENAYILHRAHCSTSAPR
jgi:hypothetical protein